MSKIIFNGVDYAGGSGNYFHPVIYSDTERKIGVWRDNKPMYAKTVHISALPSSAGSQQYPHNIANIDKVCHYESISRASSGTSVILNRVGLNGANFNGAVSYDVFVNTTVINITVGQDRSSIEADVTIWYTKTTDTAGSGDYNTYGVPTVHYSTSEQVIGTYLGKPLYQITYSGLSLVCTNANQSYATNANWGNIEKVVHSDIIDQYGQSCAGSVVYTGTPAKIAVYMQMANRTVTDITIQYTKTTD